MSRFGRRAGLGAVLIAALSTGGCIHVSRPSFLASAPRRDWGRTLESATQAAGRGRFDTADSVLASFAARYPGTHEALETSYWRALFALDPANRGSSLTAALASLDAYLANGRGEHTPEATSLRRVAGQMEVLTRLAANVGQKERDLATTARAATDTKPAEPTATDAEIKRLKDELAKANAELDRIRRRLNPPGKP